MDSEAREALAELRRLLDDELSPHSSFCITRDVAVALSNGCPDWQEVIESHPDAESFWIAPDGKMSAVE